MGPLSALRLVATLNAIASIAVVAQGAAIPWTYSKHFLSIKLGARQTNTPAEDGFLFESLEPSTSLQWVDCYERFKCSRLKVPLDYQDASKGDAAVAVMMLPADPDVEFQGTVFSFASAVGTASEGYFFSTGQMYRDNVLGTGWNFVTWDARGAGQTTPTFTCFESQDERYEFEQRERVLPDLTASTWPEWQAHYQDYNTRCQALSGDVIPYLGSIQTTRDLVSIATAMEISTINIWGFSYGANIGALLVALYPEKVGTLVLDSVSKIHEKFAPGTGAEFELTDHYKVVDYFLRACQSTGSIEGCAFYSPTVDEMRNRFMAIEDGLLKNPIEMALPEPGNYTLEHFKSDVLVVLTGIAGPASPLWTALGVFLADVEAAVAGDSPSDILAAFYAGGFASKPVSPPVDGKQQGATDSLQGISCTDSGPLGTISQDDFEALFAKFNRKDPYFGTTFLQNYLICSEWTAVNVEKLDFNLLNQKTDNTITFINHKLDPLSPLEGAKSMSRKFTNSRVITIDSASYTQILGPNSREAYAQVSLLFNTPGYKAPRNLLVQVDDSARPFGYDGSAFDV
ncbi:hypothetical protein ABW20_dc0105870 [Dactylellina cionopaga]|nr:hypothetical protein ABW20_dc0105870 [Dactylellina cionopaga]